MAHESRGMMLRFGRRGGSARRRRHREELRRSRRYRPRGRLATGHPPKSPRAHRKSTRMTQMRKLSAYAGLMLSCAVAAMAGELSQLHRTAEAGDVAGLRVALEAQPNGVDMQDDRGRTPLHAALAVGQYETAQLLIGAGADVTVVNATGMTALHLSVVHGSRTQAAQRARRSTVAALLRAGADANAQDASGATALQLALGRQRLEVLPLLVNSELERADKQGRTALHFAAQSGNTKAIALLLERGAQLAAQDHAGRTALHHAVARLQSAAVELLLARGASATHTTKNGDTVLHTLARVHRCGADLADRKAAMAEKLISAGANPDAENADGKTALELQQDCGDVHDGVQTSRKGGA